MHIFYLFFAIRTFNYIIYHYIIISQYYKNKLSKQPCIYYKQAQKTQWYISFRILSYKPKIVSAIISTLFNY